MLRLKKNDFLVGFTISILISLFVNFALLMRKGEGEGSKIIRIGSELIPISDSYLPALMNRLALQE